MFYIDGETKRTQLLENELPANYDFKNITKLNGYLSRLPYDGQLAVMIGIAKKIATLIKYDLENSVNYKDYDLFMKALSRNIGIYVYDKFITDITLETINTLIEKALRHKFDDVFKNVMYVIPDNEDGGDIICNVHEYWTEEEMELIENRLPEYRFGFRVFNII